MAVLPPQQDAQPGSHDKQQRTTPANVFDDSTDSGPKSALDIYEDAFERAVPPPAGGGYALQLFPGDGEDFGVTVTTKDGNVTHFTIPVVAVVVEHPNEENNGATIVSRVTTRLGRGKHISTCAGLLCKLGYESAFEAGKEYSGKQVARALVKALQKEPIIRDCELDWRGSYMERDARGEDVWFTHCRTVRDFPADPEHPGEYMASFPATGRSGASVIITAQPFVKTWGGKQVIKPGTMPEVATPAVQPAQQQQVNGAAATQPTPLVSQPRKRKAPVPQPVEDEEELVLA